MKKLIIYNATNEANLKKINNYIEKFEKHIQVNSYIWIVEADVSVEGIRNYLCGEIGDSESILVFELNRKWAISNHIDISDWLIDK